MSNRRGLLRVSRDAVAVMELLTMIEANTIALMTADQIESWRRQFDMDDVTKLSRSRPLQF